MTGPLEDTITTHEAVLRWAHDRLDAFAEMYVGKQGITAFDVAVKLESSLRGAVDALRAAGVVPAEPATHDTLRQAAQRLVDHAQEVRFNPNEMSVRFHDWKALRAAVAAVDGEVPADG